MDRDDLADVAETLTPRARLKLAQWLVYCEDIGWPKDSLPDLERTWRKFHDASGELIAAQVSREKA